MNPGMQRGGLPRADHHDRLALIRHQILSHRIDKLRGVILLGRNLFTFQLVLDSRLNQSEQIRKIRRPNRQPVVGHCAGPGVCGLDDIHPVHLALFRRPTTRILPSQAHRLRMANREVRIQRQNDIRSGEIDLRPHGRPKRSGRTSPNFIPIDRVKFDPFRFGEHLLESGPQVGQSHRGARPRQHAQGFPLLRPLGIENRSNGLRERIPRGRFGRLALPHLHAHGPIRVVHLQDQRLRQRVGRTETGRMFRIAFRLDRPTVVTGDHQRLGDAPQLPTGGELLRHTGNPTGWSLHERRNDLPFPATRQPAQGQRRAHQLQPATTRNPFRELRGRFRKLTRQHRLEVWARLQLVQTSPVRRLLGHWAGLGRT